ncbi:P2R1A-PPP2R2A-interacting phosphatase regulator 1 isoform X2 [Boleophthalmus pectinirostris]|uniref:P2R1A-PPP2R2A-interacting phosphatase regulator 1 isoform X2 n=1 Tax=Boleophthalmus pectinirostris TaxID=150288 RepID=UPI002430BEB7|nr:P2R1A-PPP2R2A-interacting phosphatase regulator 1 isoform X2 [Boleophthalmus pectinirostris]
MERMEVEPCAGAAGGGALRRSNSAPMITSVSDGSTVFGPSSSARFRRSSVSVNPSGPSLQLPLSSFPLNTDRTETKRHEDLGLALRGSLQRLSASSLVPAPAASHWSHSNTWSPPQDSGVTPNSSPSPTRRFRPAVRWPPVAPLKRKVCRRGRTRLLSARRRRSLPSLRTSTSPVLTRPTWLLIGR